jgi:hypothetical protein
MVTNVENRNAAFGIVRSAPKTREIAARPTTAKPRQSFLVSLLRALSAFAV